jgi:ubiquinone/menaquinone biosynthesis C-methylase UbiE
MQEMNVADVDPVAPVYTFERGSATSTARSGAERIIEFYDEAGIDYEHWSSGLNMHLGFYRNGLRLYDREAMLEQMNLEIASRLQIKSKATVHLIDLGCGAGSIARTIAKTYPDALIKGVTIVPSQVDLASELNAREGLRSRIEVLEASFAKLPVDNRSVDGVWAVESSCYARGADKADLVGEMARVLKNGGRFVIADCFIKKPEKQFNWLVNKCYLAACESWALTEMPVLERFVGSLKINGFTEIVVEDISWRVVPSLVHAPFAVSSFVLKKILRGEKLKRHSLNNLKASLLATILGLNRSKFSYCLISGKSAD